MLKAQPRQTETELKLIISRAGERSLAEHAAFKPPRASEPRSQRLVTTYFDTPNQSLAERGLTLRVRRAGGRRIQTVKSVGKGGVATSRGEWEWPLSGDEPDLRLAAGTPVADRLSQGVDDELRPVVVTDVMRTTRTVELEGNTIEAALDSGSIAAGDAKESINELELELREGARGALYRLALALHAATPLAVEVESKAARGYRLKAGTGPHATEASAPDLDRDVRAADGFRQIVANALSHLLANRAAALAGDAEGIHQTRVAIRRLRTALGLFAPRLETHATSIFQDELRRIGRIIGEGRDWDVFCLEMLPQSFDDTKDEMKEAGWGRLMGEAADTRRRAADAACAREIGAASYTGLVLGLSAWIEDGQERRSLLGDKRLNRPLSDIAPQLLDRLARKVVRRGRRMSARASAATLHPLHMSLKKLRYGVEFLSSLYPRKSVKAFLRPLKKLQRGLGTVNDSATAIRLAEQLAREGRADLGVATGALARSREQATRDATRKLKQQWSAFQRQQRYWR